MIDRDELGAWLRLLETPGVGRETARRLLAAFGSAEAVLAASTQARGAVAGAAAAGALAGGDASIDARVDATWAWLTGAGDEQREVLVLGDRRYPEALLHSADPPLLLYTRGRVELLATPAIAIVGSRNPTAQGLENARAFAAHLGRAGFTIVSGLALGIDGAAHEGALEAGVAHRSRWSAPGSTASIRRAIGRSRCASPPRACIVSEFAIGTPALAENFPIRNRIIAGLTRGTLVVEAALQSGSLITARLAAENGREVFAIPGSIHSPQSRGCHALIKQGAKLVDAGRTTSSRSSRGGHAGRGRGRVAARRAAAQAPIRCSTRSASIRSARRAGRPHRAQRRRSRPGCSTSSSTAASPGCPGQLFQRLARA